MTARARIVAALGAIAMLAALSGCVSGPAPYDYSAYRDSPPRSILVLPPLNESISMQGTYSYLATVTRPLAERGYYVFPVAVVDQLLRENGMPTPGEMHQVSLQKVREITGADAVLYPVLHNYGSSYQIVSSTTVVDISARLVDTRSGRLLWNGTAKIQQGSGGSGNILADMVGAVVSQMINSHYDPGYQASHLANVPLFETQGRELPYGPYHPAYNRTK